MCRRFAIFTVVILLIVPDVSCESSKSSGSALTGAERQMITAELLALDDARAAAADRGDADAALAMISRRSDFRYDLGGRIFQGFAEFEELVRRSYKNRMSMVSTVLSRKIHVRSRDEAQCISRVKHDIVRTDGFQIRAVVDYVSVWGREDEGWRLIRGTETDVVEQ